MVGIFVTTGGREFILDTATALHIAKRKFVEWYSNVEYTDISVRYAEVIVKEK